MITAEQHLKQVNDEFQQKLAHSLIDQALGRAEGRIRAGIDKSIVVVSGRSGSLAIHYVPEDFQEPVYPNLTAKVLTNQDMVGMVISLRGNDRLRGEFYQSSSSVGIPFGVSEFFSLSFRAWRKELSSVQTLSLKWQKRKVAYEYRIDGNGESLTLRREGK